jgi:predicted secreted Zn-dependent protease
MRLMSAGLALVLIAGPVDAAMAGTRVVVTTQTYSVSGATSTALLDAMDRSGPRRGFMTRAIAQTSYTVDWNLKVKRAGDTCRLVDADGTLHLTYIFPQVASPMAPQLKRRWRRFFAGVQAHEHTHGRIARAMVAASRKAVVGISTMADPACGKTRIEAQRRIKAVYAKFEAEQNAFDVREHGRGGRVERLVEDFIR